MANFKHTEIKGVIPALITPFDENENFLPIPYEVIPPFVAKFDDFHCLYPLFS